MKLLLVDNAYMYQAPDGKFYSPSIYVDSFFERYLSVFESVRFACKVKQIKSDSLEGLVLITNPNVEIYPIPWYKGLKELLRKLCSVVGAFRRVFKECDCCILRIVQIESIFAYVFSNMGRRPFAVEVVNDPMEWRNLNAACRTLVVICMRLILAHADGASYVTEGYLQKNTRVKKC